MVLMRYFGAQRLKGTLASLQWLREAEKAAVGSGPMNYLNPACTMTTAQASRVSIVVDGDLTKANVEAYAALPTVGEA